MAPFTVKFQNQDRENDQLADAPRPELASNLLQNVIDDVTKFVVKSSPEEVKATYHYYCLGANAVLHMSRTQFSQLGSCELWRSPVPNKDQNRLLLYLWSILQNIFQLKIDEDSHLTNTFIILYNSKKKS